MSRPLRPFALVAIAEQPRVSAIASKAAIPKGAKNVAVAKEFLKYAIGTTSS
jgi:hypothetical protein